MSLRSRVGNKCFSALLIAQLLFWVYICFGESSTGVAAPTEDIQTRNLAELELHEKVDLTPGPLGGERVKRNTDVSDMQNHFKQVPQVVNVIGNDEHQEDKEPTGLIQVKAPKLQLIPKEMQPAAIDTGKPPGFNMSSEDLETWHKYYNPQLGHTILPRNASFVLYGTFLKNPQNLCRRHDDLDLVIVVHTAPYNFDRRQRLRQVFGDPSWVHPYTVQLVFAIGTLNSTMTDPDKSKILENENAEHGDFVQMDFQENFRNLSYKAITWLRWLDENCPNALMVLKIDDDVILDLRRVLPLSRGLFSKYKRSIFCNINKVGTQPIPRRGRTVVDPREFLGVTIYPYTYCSGFIVFLSRDLIPVLHEAVKRTPLYNVDDLFMFGIVPKVAGHVTYHNIGFNVTLWGHKVYNCTILQGSSCRYFGTMAQTVEESNKVYYAIDRAHAHDFHFPRLTVVGLP